MKSPVSAIVSWLLLIAAIGFYGYGVIEAIILSWPNDVPVDYEKYPEIISATVSTLQALLLTNLGMVLGISIAKPESALARNLMLGPSGNKLGVTDLTDPTDIAEKIQLFSMLIYIISLIACLITWGHNSFATEKVAVVPVITESGKMFVGVVIAYFTVVLSLKNKDTRYF